MIFIRGSDYKYLIVTNKYIIKKGDNIYKYYDNILK